MRRTPPEVLADLEELNLNYIMAELESEYLYHMTRFNTLKKILKDGRLIASITRSSIPAKHITVSFTSGRMNHLSKLPNMPMLFGAWNNCYLRFRADDLDVLPVVYPFGRCPKFQWGLGWWKKVAVFDAHRLVKPEIIYETFTDEQLEHLVYNPMWLLENEHRHFGDVVLEEHDYTIHVTTRYQQKSLEKMGFESEIDKELRKVYQICNRLK